MKTARRFLESTARRAKDAVARGFGRGKGRKTRAKTSGGGATASGSLPSAELLAAGLSADVRKALGEHLDRLKPATLASLAKSRGYGGDDRREMRAAALLASHAMHPKGPPRPAAFAFDREPR